MTKTTSEQVGRVLFIPHGGGPIPLFEQSGHEEMIAFLKSIVLEIKKPDAIVIISAHWEESEVTITGGHSPDLIYDYYGFPKEMYDVEYGAPGDTQLAEEIHQLFTRNDIKSEINPNRGFDHGMYVPLKIMYPEANIPCIQISLVKGLDPAHHIMIGKALKKLRDKNILIIGSGFSFHNLKELLSPSAAASDSKNESFEQWLIDTCTDNSMSEKQRERHLIEWDSAPHARYCHPREEHLIPLHVCYGASATEGKLVFRGTILGKKASAYLW